MATGDYQCVVDEALSGDFERSLQKRPSDDLWALSDAARYVGRLDVARRALLAQRARFPHTENAVRAAFHLGALAEQQSASSRDALRWYDAYLSEAPAGALVADTLRRKMSILQRSGDAAGARSAAERYMREFPGGPYRRQADHILGRQ